jgi:hypothetical protein
MHNFYIFLSLIYYVFDHEIKGIKHVFYLKYQSTYFLIKKKIYISI